MFKLSKILKLVRQPVETITFIFALGLAFFACYVLSPWYETSYTSVMSALDMRTQEKAVAIVFILTSMLGLMFPLSSDHTRLKILKYANFFMFLDFLFLAALRVLSVGWVPMHWLPLLLLALVCGVFRLFLEVKKE